MAAVYAENPLIFLNSSDKSIPRGRNVRLQHRSQKAAPASSTRNVGKVIVFDGLPADKTRPKPSTRKRRETSDERVKRLPTPPADLLIDEPTLSILQPSLSPGRKTSLDAPGRASPGDLLTLAASHIRRIATLSLRSHTPHVVDVLRYRQWASIPLELDGFGRTPFLDGAVRCVEAKMRQIAFDNISPLLILSEYDRTLQYVHQAVQARRASEDKRLMTAIQLLAIFEMLDGPENPSWQKHVSGARSVFESRLSQPAQKQACQRRPFLQSAPMLADALLENNYGYFHRTPWRPLLERLISEQVSDERDAEQLIACFADLPGLMAETEQLPADADLGVRFGFLSRAQGMKFRVKTALLEGKMDALGRGGSRFDFVGLSMAALYALDRIVTAVAPRELIQLREYIPGKTDYVCIRVLESEMARADSWSEMKTLFDQYHGEICV